MEPNAARSLRALIVAAAAGAAGCTAGEPAPDLSTLPSVIDGPGDEAWLTVHPDGRLILFGRHQPDYSNHHIYLTRLIDGEWTEPVEAPFTGGLEATAPHFAPDGRSVLFLAGWSPSREDRPRDEREGNIWRVTWDGTNWGEPQLLPAPINSPATEIDAVEVNGGAIYFTSMRAGGAGPKMEYPNTANQSQPDMYRAVPDSAGGYRIEALPFNTKHTESTLYVAPDESLIVFHRAEDPRGLGKDDLFAARRQGDGWGPEIHLVADVNSPEYEYGPEVSPDGGTLYFTTHRGGQAGIMAVDLAAAMGR